MTITTIVINNMLKIAASRNVECIKGMGEKLPLKGSSMKLVLMVTSLFFMDNGRALGEAYRALALEGFLIVAFIERNRIPDEKHYKNEAESSFQKILNFTPQRKSYQCWGYMDLRICILDKLYSSL